jgi:autoinducer 2-degrading protein
MFAVCVEFQLREGQSEAFLPLMYGQAENSLSLEEGCVRFDVLINAENPDTVFLYEIYASKDTFATHLESDHFQAFDAATGPMVSNKSVATYDRLFTPGNT